MEIGVKSRKPKLRLDVGADVGMRVRKPKLRLEHVGADVGSGAQCGRLNDAACVRSMLTIDGRRNGAACGRW